MQSLNCNYPLEMHHEIENWNRHQEIMWNQFLEDAIREKSMSAYQLIYTEKNLDQITLCKA